MAESKRWNSKTRGTLAAVILLAAGLAVAAHGGLFDSVFKKSPVEIAKAAGVVDTGGKTVLMVAHNRANLFRATRSVRLRDGRVAEDHPFLAPYPAL